VPEALTCLPTADSSADLTGSVGFRSQARLEGRASGRSWDLPISFLEAESMAPDQSAHLSNESPNEHDERDRHLGVAAGIVLESYREAHPDDPDQAAEMTVRVAMDILDEFKPARRGRTRSPWADTSPAPSSPAEQFRTLAQRDWLPLDEQKRELFISIVRRSAPGG
jgi:hypothetical protein